MQPAFDQPPVATEVQVAPATKTFTLGELGPRLPIGTIDPNTGLLRKDMTHKRWTLRQEKELGALKEEFKKQNVARFCSVVLAKLFTQLGHFSFDTDDERGLAKAQLAISQMFVGDVFYAYVWLRRQCIGPELDINTVCPHCQHAGEVKADLDTLEVNAVEKIDDTRWTARLRDGITLRKKEVFDLFMRPPLWSAFESTSGAGRLDTGAMKSALITGSVAGVPGLEQVALTEAEFEDMTKYDLELLAKQIDAEHIGPVLAVESRCVKCRSEFRVPIEWMYDSFFSISGRFDRKRA